MTIKLKKKKDAMTMRIQKEQQEETAKLVSDHSKEMLELLKQEQEKIKKELEEELVSCKSIKKERKKKKICRYTSFQKICPGDSLTLRLDRRVHGSKRLL